MDPHERYPPTMALADPFDTGSQLSKAVLALHSSLPLVVGVYHFIASTASYLKRSRNEDEKAPKKSLHRLISWLVFGVIVTYVSYMPLKSRRYRRSHPVMALNLNLLLILHSRLEKRSCSYMGHFLALELLPGKIVS